MSNASAVNFQRNHPQEDYESSLSTMPASGLLTPPMMYNLDTRRDSIASANTSLSFGSCSTDYSMPVTPTHVESPLAGRDFADIIPYEHNQELQDEFFHGPPMEPKSLVGADDGMCEPWVLENSNASMNAHSAGFYFESHTSAQPTFETSMVPPRQFVWDTWPTADSSTSHQLSNHASSFDVSRGAASSMWVEPMNFDHAPHMATLQTSADMADVEDEYVDVRPPTSVRVEENDYVMVPSPYLSHSKPFGELTCSFAQSPQEVCFKQEHSPSPVKREPENDCRALRLEPLIYESPTGGKSVKREQSRRSKVYKERKSTKGLRRTKSLKGPTGGGYCPRLVQGQIWDVKEDGEFFWDEKNREYRSRTVRESHRCRKCFKAFRREEHRTRHEKSTHRYAHSDPSEIIVPEYPCIICVSLKINKEPFNRYDNLVVHWQTHISKEGCKSWRNPRMSLREVQAYFKNDPKTMEKIETMYMNTLRKDEEKKRLQASP